MVRCYAGFGLPFRVSRCVDACDQRLPYEKIAICENRAVYPETFAKLLPEPLKKAE